jgi:hypothetical protein
MLSSEAIWNVVTPFTRPHGAIGALKNWFGGAQRWLQQSSRPVFAGPPTKHRASISIG